MKKFAENMLDFIYESPTQFNAVAVSAEILEKNGFEKLNPKENWKLEVGKKYYTTKNSSALVAFKVNSDEIEKEGFRIIGSHTDSPGFRIKPNAEMESCGAYLKLNTEGYGGMILSTWLDRPLAMAGRVFLRGENPFKPVEKIVNINKPVCIIPNLAIHMNRSINDGYKYNKQTDMLPLVGLINEQLEKDNYMVKLLASELDVEVEEIIDFDIFLYEYEKGCFTGANEEFISTGRLDNLSMYYSSVEALLDSDSKSGISIAVGFDNEEVGSSTKQGADSNMLLNILERICISLGKDRQQFFEAIENSFIISSDLAHAVHPNVNGMADPTNRPVMGKGPVIKVHAGQAYTSDGYSISVYKEICRECGVEYQEFVNKSDQRGGSTIGPISSTHIDIPSVDIGAPILSMHSIRELGCSEDFYNTYKTFVKFYEI
ncbi:M18 family aminopeptidase [Peptoclostridium sp. AF21-18]|uniref:M18 family aminopeptidase n=1 Tax=Peptoclostridium sp. AF21-18 TaxID=2292243 RepID=UPI000E5142EE|nr:M18 family aminopeptidase [Peptoclostridium sp. AF21-18]RHQ97822.1 M18 family aminopeptidase [Peptoclostridium sp. AF21-18]